MKLIPAIIALLVSPLIALAGEVSALERAIRELPPQFVADIPLAQRGALLQSLRSNPSDTRLDLAHGYLHFYSDGGDHGAIGGTSMFYMRQFQREGGGFVVLTHMAKPFADGSTPRANQTFVFERRHGKWADITTEVFPARIDLTSHFRPLRASAVVVVAPYARIKRVDGRGYAYDFGPPALELHWNGHVFQKRKPSKTALSEYGRNA
jgi:hypothetical protein